MAELLKDRYHTAFLMQVGEGLAQVLPGLVVSDFVAALQAEPWPRLELKQRMRHISHELHRRFDRPFPQVAPLLARLTDVSRQQSGHTQSFEYLFLADYVQVYGLDHPEVALPLLRHITAFTSAEFAIRPFLKADPLGTMAFLADCAKDPDAHVRRFASEGCRPLLPWGERLPAFVTNPEPIFPILERLKADPSDYVRRSVANNLNDISKNQPERVLELARRWMGQHPDTDALLRHACRGLLKAGQPEVLALFQVHPVEIELRDFQLSALELAIGETLDFSFTVRLAQAEPALLRLEYAVDYQKKSGQLSRKVFQIESRPFVAGESRPYQRKQRFTDFTTRTHYPGLHRLHLLVNGQVRASQSFHLTSPN